MTSSSSGSGGASGLADHADTLSDLASNPTEWLREHVYQLIVEAFLSLVFEGLDMLRQIGAAILYSSVGTALRAFYDAFAVIGEIPIDMLRLMHDVFVSASTAAGPFAPFIYMVLWTSVTAIVIGLGSLAWSQIVGRLPVIST